MRSSSTPTTTNTVWTISCQHHCVAILGTRLFAILCNEQVFQQKLINENSEAYFNLIIEILYPNNDPVSRGNNIGF